MNLISFNIKKQSFHSNLGKILRFQQLCEVLGISTKTGYKLLSNGTIAALKVGRMYRIPKVHVLTYLRILNTASKV